MIEAAETARGFVSGKMRSDLDTDRLLALVRAIEVVGEAASKVSSKNSGCRSRHTVGIDHFDAQSVDPRLFRRRS